MSLKPKTYEEALAKHKPLRRTGFVRKASESLNTLKPKPLQRRSRLKPGKKVKAWDRERARLKKRFEKVGITTCELRGVVEHDCKYDDYLSFAHSTKRSDELFDISEVVLCCIPAHTILDEQMSHSAMYEIVKAVIANREIQP